MVYSWDVHQAKCYRLYIVENKSLEEIMDIMRIEDNFTPSKRAYQTQFRRWKFPSKQNPAHKDDRLVARVKELWNKNLSQREMLHILNDDDGFGIKLRELTRLRTRQGLLLRKPNPNPSSRQEIALTSSNSGFASQTVPESPADEAPRNPHSQPREPKPVLGSTNLESDSTEADWPDRPKFLDQERGDTGKTRRRARYCAGMPQDHPRPPRFPSETTIDESRVILKLDTKLYLHMRTVFARICNDEGVTKKTIAGPEKWESVQHRLIGEIEHLQSIICVDAEGTESKRLALDVICTDVTKRLRSMEQKMTIADAKAALGINPEEYRTIRQDFAGVLENVHSKSKTEAGPEHWEVLKQNWRTKSSILRKLFAPDTSEPEYHNRLRAIDVVARDVMKRLRDNQSKGTGRQQRMQLASKSAVSLSGSAVLEDAELQLETANSPKSDHGQQTGLVGEFVSLPAKVHPGISNPMIAGTPHTSQVRTGNRSPHVPQEHIRPLQETTRQHRNLGNTLPSESLLPQSPSHHQTPLISDNILSNALPIDPEIGGAISTLLTAQGQPLGPQHAQSPFPLAQDLTASVVHSPHAYVQNPYTAQSNTRPPIAVYLRLHHSSPLNVGPPVWIVELRARTFEELRQVAVKDFPGTICGRVFGILDESVIEVTRDDELTAYLAVLEGRNSAGMPGTPCFYVQVLPGAWKAQ